MDRIPKWLVETIAVLFAAFMLLLVIGQIRAFPNNASLIGSNNNQHTITIPAEGKITAVPDTATVNASIVTQAATAQDAQSQNNAKADKIIAFIKNQGIADKDIQTTNYNVAPQYNFPKNTRNLNSYTFNQTLTVKVHDFSKLNVILDGVTANGANEITGVSYGFDNPDALKEQAREAALANARAQAQKLADATGLKLGKVITFSETNNTPYPIPYAVGAPMARGAANSDTQIQPGSQEIDAQVSVTYEVQ